MELNCVPWSAWASPPLSEGLKGRAQQHTHLSCGHLCFQPVGTRPSPRPQALWKVALGQLAPGQGCHPVGSLQQPELAGASGRRVRAAGRGVLDWPSGCWEDSLALSLRPFTPKGSGRSPLDHALLGRGSRDLDGPYPGQACFCTAFVAEARVLSEGLLD